MVTTDLLLTIIIMQNITDWHLGILILVVVSLVLLLLVIGYSIPATLPRVFTSPDGENRYARNVSLFSA